MKNLFLLSVKSRLGIWLIMGAMLLNSPTIRASVNEATQKIIITGTVVDANKEPLIGVSVLIPGTASGTVTDIDGKFSLSVPDTKLSLLVSYVGYTAQKVEVGNQKNFHIVLQEDFQQLDEVVVVGYGVQKKSHLTGSITKVNTAGLDEIPVSRIDQALQGRVAGMQIQNTTSEVGVSPQIRVRGIASISAESAPLVIVDGFPLEDGLGVINAGDVESIEILKDAASAAIYGSRAANGVIIVTTKSGTASKPKYSLKTSWGVKDVYELHPIMTSRDYVGMLVEEAKLSGARELPRNEFPFYIVDNNTNWQEEALRSSHIYQIQFGIQGGNKDLKYMVSGSYMDDQGVMYKNDFTRMNVRAKIDAKLSSKVSVGINLAPTYSYRERPGVNFMDFYRTPSWMPVRHTEQTAAITGYPVGSYANGYQFNNTKYSGYDPISGAYRTDVIGSPFGTSSNNPKMIMDNVYQNQTDYRLSASGYIKINIIKGLEFKSSNSFNYIYSDVNQYQNKNAKKDNDPNRGLYQNRLNLDILSENTFDYHTTINKVHDITALAGFSVQKTDNKTAGILGYDFPTDYIQTLNASTRISQYEGDRQYTGTWAQDEALASLYSRLTYAYDERYLFSTSFRTDGSSKFGADNLWAYFPSVSAGWRMSEEHFIKDNITWVEQLKLRASYGVTGTNHITNYANMNKLQSASYPLGTGTGSVVSGMANTSAELGNEALRWEQTNEYNVGLDLSVLKNRIGLTADLYYSKTKSLLFKKEISAISGYTQAWTNEGQVRNKGLEIELNTFNIQKKTFTWKSSFNFTANRNKLLDLGGPKSQVSFGEREEMYLAEVGAPIVQFYGFKAIGVWENQDQINDNPHHINDVAGGLRVENTNGDGAIDDKDMVALGSPLPDFIWGVTNNLKYLGFDFSFLIQGSQGGKIFNGDETYNESRKYNLNYVTGRWVNADHPGDGKTPFYNNGLNHALTDYNLQDASYFSLRDVTLGYTLPKKTLKKFTLSYLRIYATVQNLYYWWPEKYKGVNPEARATSGAYSSPLIAGCQRGAFPLQKTFNFGIDINF